MADLDSGHPLDGDERFRVLGFLGRGGLGAVYRVFDRELGNVVALKTIETRGPDSMARLKHEFRVVAGITHRNLIQLHDLVVRPDTCFFTMEYVPGCDFLEYVRRGPGGDEPEARLRRLGLALPQVVRGLATLHAFGRLHRDVKPSNVRVDPAGRVVILDFDLALPAAESGGLESGSGATAGTFAYMAPEQLWGLGVGPAADWFGLGVMLHEALTGWHPFGGRPPPLPGEGHGFDSSLLLAADAVPESLARLVTALLDPDPERRPGSDALLHALDSLPEEYELSSPRNLAEPRTELVGRERELGVLREAVHARDELRTVGIHGPSGIGKSELVRRMLGELASESPDAVILAGRCHPSESVPFRAFDPVIDALGRYLRKCEESERAELLPPEAGAASRLFPVLAEVPGMEAPAADGPPDVLEVRRQAVGALRRILGRLAARRSLVIWIDDAQWSDEDSAELLDELLVPGDAPPLRLLLGYRDDPGEPNPLLAVLRRRARTFAEVHFEELPLGPLTESEAFELVRRLSPGAAAQEARLGSLVRQARGSPFLLNTLLWHLRTQPLEPEPSSLPLRLEDAISRRVGLLAARERRLLELICVCGRPMERSLALEAAHLGERGRPLARHLEDLGLVRTVPSTAGRLAVESYHDRIRETVIEALPTERRANRHRELALAFERSGRAGPEVLAHHFHAAGDLARAHDHAIRAAEAAEHALAFSRAAELYGSARAWAPGNPESERALLVREAEARTKAARLVEAGRLFLRAAEGAPRTAKLEARRRAAENLVAGGAVDEGLETLRTVLEALGLRYPSSPGRATLASLTLLVGVSLRRLDRVRAVEALDEESRLRIDTCYGAARNLVNADPARGIYFGLVALAQALRAREPIRLGQALCVVGGSIAVAGGPLAILGRRMLRAAEAIAARRDAPVLWGVLEISRGRVRMLEGRALEAVAQSSAGVERLGRDCPGHAFECIIGRGTVLRALEDLGRFDELGEGARELRDAARAAGNAYAEATAAMALGIAHLAADEPAIARELARHSRRPWARRAFHIQHLYATRLEVLCDLYELEPEAGWARLEAVEPDLRASGLLRIPLIRVDHLALRARLAVSLAARHPGGSGVWAKRARRDLRGLRRLGRPDARLHEALLGAGLRALSGRPRAACRDLERGISRGETLGNRSAVACARWRRGEMVGEWEAAARGRMELRECGVASPDRFAALLCPGLPSGRDPAGSEG